MHYNKREEAFTLIELLISLTIVTIIILSIGGIYSDSVKMRSSASEYTLNARVGNAILEVMRKDINFMAFYPERDTIFFSIKTDRDGMGSRQDAISFDCLVPFKTENGITAYRFGRVSYYTEEQLGVSEYKKLIRKTVYINDEYKDIEETEEEEKRKEEKEAGKLEANDENKDKEKKPVKVEEIKIDRDEVITILSRGITSFSIDVPSREQMEWEEEDVKGQVPKGIKVTVGITEERSIYEEDSGQRREVEFSTIFLPVMARYVANPYNKEEKKDFKGKK